MNPRWIRNMPNIVLLTKKMEQLELQLDDAELTEEEIEEVKLQLVDLNNEIKGLQKPFSPN